MSAQMSAVVALWVVAGVFAVWSFRKWRARAKASDGFLQSKREWGEHPGVVKMKAEER